MLDSFPPSILFREAATDVESFTKGQTIGRRSGLESTSRQAAAIGAVAGAQAGECDQGRRIGGLICAGLGTLIASKTGGEPVELPAGTQLTLTLRDTVEERFHGQGSGAESAPRGRPRDS